MPSLSDWDRVVGGRAEAPAESAAPEQPEQPQVLGMDESEDISSQNPFAFESSAPFEMDQLPREESLEAKGKAELKDQLKVYAKDPMFVNALHNSKTSEVFLETRTEQLYLQDTRLAEHEGEPPDELKKQIREETFQRALEPACPHPVRPARGPGADHDEGRAPPADQRHAGPWVQQ